MAEHAELSGSTSYRWIHCPGSVGMIKSLGTGGGGGGGSSQYGREGTFAHAVAAHILTTDKIPEVGSEFLFNDHGEEIAAEITDEMLEHVMVYVDHVRMHGRRGIIRVEQHLDLSSFVREAMWGTGDAIISKPDELVICDFKYGFYPVRLVDENLLLDSTYGELSHINSQLLYYAAGAANQYEWRHGKILLEIVQPRCMEVPDVQSVYVDPAQLRAWAENDLYKAAHLATSENPPLAAGDWCRFCPALHVCPEARRTVQEMAVSDFEEMITPELPVPDESEKLTKILNWAPIIDAWLRACEARALEIMRNGVKIPGFKLVERRSNRRWPEDLSNEQIFKRLKVAGGAGTLRHFLVTEFISPAKAEKIAGKAAVNAVAVHPRGELTVAAESDRRPAIDPMPDFEEFR